jgi:CRISPR/Cas system-associated exonuclease Cas4 (RecB family)
MPIKKKQVYQFTAWSYSRLSDYLLCPLKAKLKHLLKMKEPESPVLARGSAVHKEAADYVLGNSPAKLPESLKLFPDEFKLFRKLKALVETQWAFDSKWNPLPMPDGWFSPEAWLRIVVDTHVYIPKEKLIDIVDHKTGKIRPEQMEQLELYIIGGFLKYPEAQKARARFWYLDQGEERKVEYTRDQLPALQKKWEGKVKGMMVDKNFAPRPNDKCRWCHWRAELGGPCKF